jgi:hypothetical protein
MAISAICGRRQIRLEQSEVSYWNRIKESLRVIMTDRSALRICMSVIGVIFGAVSPHRSATSTQV